mmetsp:Transcript_37561/g.81842  ORF Transcript_37561/g.81842 Transcript_37561/m.81842 type:complete len:376 (+) Transcript_37561:196-1323(+)
MMLATILLPRWCCATVLLVVGWSVLHVRRYYETTARFALSPSSPVESPSLRVGDVRQRSQQQPQIQQEQQPQIQQKPLFQPFNWTNLDLSRKGSCGLSKCFYHSSLKDDEGYLVARSKNGTRYHERLHRVWERAEQMSKLGVEVDDERGENDGTVGGRGRHFFLEPPLNVAYPSRSTLKQLNKMTHGPGKSRHYYGNLQLYNAEVLRRGGATLVVQKVRVAPAPNLICRCYFFRGGDRERGRFKLDDLSSNRDEFRSAVQSREAFMATFLDELKRLARLVADDYFSRLFYDFQFLLDAEGRIHHIDLDRMENTGYVFPNKEGAKLCFGGALRKVAGILLLDGDGDNNTTMAAMATSIDDAVNDLLRLVKVVKIKK